MRRKRQSGRRRIWRKAHRRSDALSPVLSAIRPETPPEGLLQSIEREIESTGRKPRARRKRAWAASMFPLAAAIAGIAILGAVLSTDRTDLLDPAGRPVARLETRGETTTARLLGARVAVESSKSWHLWGIVSDGQPSVHLGAFAARDISLQTPERFAGFAISLEEKGFSGASPAGPVLPLLRKK